MSQDAVRTILFDLDETIILEKPVALRIPVFSSMRSGLRMPAPTRHGWLETISIKTSPERKRPESGESGSIGKAENPATVSHSRRSKTCWHCATSCENSLWSREAGAIRLRL